MTAATRSARLTWRALRDGIAHGHLRGPRTLCELPAIAERDAWPAQRRCRGCELVARDLRLIPDTLDLVR